MPCMHRTREKRTFPLCAALWIPAFAGMTFLLLVFVNLATFWHNKIWLPFPGVLRDWNGVKQPLSIHPPGGGMAERKSGGFTFPGGHGPNVGHGTPYLLTAPAGKPVMRGLPGIFLKSRIRNAPWNTGLAAHRTLIDFYPPRSGSNRTAPCSRRPETHWAMFASAEASPQLQA